MRVSLNLASRPYVELRPLYKRLRLLIAILVITGAAFWFVLRTEYVRAQQAQARVDVIQTSVARIQAEQRQDQAVMQQPREAGILQQAQFLNNLFLHKAFSWTAVMMDLERVLPAGVQVTNIDPAVAKDGHVTVRLRVLGQHDRAVDLMRNLEKSRRFLSPRLTAESAENGGNSNPREANLQNTGLTNGVTFEIVADYNPLPLKLEKTSESSTEKSAEGKTPGTPRRHRAARPSSPGNTPAAGTSSPGPRHGGAQ